MSHDRASIERPISISPPPKRRRMLMRPSEDVVQQQQRNQDELSEQDENAENLAASNLIQANDDTSSQAPRATPSPVQLNFVDALSASSNVDTVSLGSILGNVMIRKCWLFNYLFDLDFVM